MRKLIPVAVLLVAVGFALFWRLSGSTRDFSASTLGASAGSAQAPSGAGRAGTVPRPQRPEDGGSKGTADPGSTPALAQAPSEADGVLEVEVLAGAKPVPGASVRLYWRGPRDPNLDEVSWRLASTGTTDAQGRARLASRTGSYLLAVRAQGYAPLRRDVVRPSGEARTVLRLTLEQGLSLIGRTVERGSREPVPLVELALTAHGHELELWERPEVPAEERVYASSDARGDFRVEGLAPGSYLLEAHTLGHARALLRRVKVPAAGPLTVELQAASVIEGFVVDAQGHPAAGAEVQASGQVPEVTTSGSGGGFSVEVEAGTYTVSARRGSEAGASDKPVIVSAGKTVREVRIRLGQGSALEGRVVAHGTGTPIPGASVDVSPFSRNGDSGRAVTDASGHFAVEGLAPGSYDLVAGAPGFTSLTRRALTVAAGERFPVELELQRSGAVEGYVRDGSGQPVPGAQIEGERWTEALTSAPVVARTDAEGHYRLEGLSIGRQVLLARREDATFGVDRPVSISEGVTAQVDFTLEEIGTLEGVIQATSGPLPTERLLVMAAPLPRRDFVASSAHPIEADATGSFRLSLPAGGYQVYAVVGARGGFTRPQPKSVEIEAGKTAHVELVLPEKRAAEGLHGQVLEPDGAPSAGAFVTVTGDSPERPRWVVTADEQGRFELALVTPVEAPLPLLRVAALNGGRMGGVQGVKAGEEVVVKLQPAASARGRVVRSSGGAPVKGFTLMLLPQDPEVIMPASYTWEFAGDRFEVQDFPALSMRLKVLTADGAGGEALVSPAAGVVSEVEVPVKSLASVRGRVVDGETQEPVAGAVVFLKEESYPRPSAGTAADGRFTLENVPAGEQNLVITGGHSKAPAGKLVTLVEGQTLDVGDIVLTR